MFVILSRPTKSRPAVIFLYQPNIYFCTLSLPTTSPPAFTFLKLLLLPPLKLMATFIPSPSTARMAIAIKPIVIKLSIYLPANLLMRQHGGPCYVIQDLFHRIQNNISSNGRIFLHEYSIEGDAIHLCAEMSHSVNQRKAKFIDLTISL